MATGKGARVVGTVSTDEKEALARGAGAAEVVRYDREDLVERVRQARQRERSSGDAARGQADGARPARGRSGAV